MTILTGWWFSRLPDTHIHIGVSRSNPRRMRSGPRLPEVFPGAWFQSVDVEEYRARYAQIQADLDPAAVVAPIERLAAGRIPVLSCWEKAGSGQWCHRSFLSCWLCLHLGLVVEEYGCEGQGFADTHPLLPPEYRRSLQTPAQPAPPAQLPLL